MINRIVFGNLAIESDTENLDTLIKKMELLLKLSIKHYTETEKIDTHFENKSSNKKKHSEFNINNASEDDDKVTKFNKNNLTYLG